MKIISLRRFRYRLVDFVVSNPSAFKSFLLRTLILSALVVMNVPGQVSREIVFGRLSTKPDLKTSLRSMLWLWNRSWIPIKHPLVSYFDIGWFLSSPSCHALRSKGFVSKNHLKAKCDIAQYMLADLKVAIEDSSTEKINLADQKVVQQVRSILNDAAIWAKSKISPAAKETSLKSDENQASKTPAKGFDNESTKAALLDFDSLCNAIGQEFFLISGTFLGAVRDGKFIGHDHDIDVGVFENSNIDALIGALQNSTNFALTKVDRIYLRNTVSGHAQYSVMQQPAILKVFHHEGTAIDVFVHFKEGNVIWHGSSVHRWDNQGFELACYDFLEHTFLGPQDYDRYLTENYGKDWRTPKRNFDTDLDTPNMRFVGSANALVFFAWMLSRAVWENDRLRVDKYLELLQSLEVIRVENDAIEIN